jgi:hypothetical protein|eukprot:COSAG06_NODE_12095_length_1424_cov_16.250566_2_plen_48_part_00
MMSDYKLIMALIVITITVNVIMISDYKLIMALIAITITINVMISDYN